MMSLDEVMHTTNEVLEKIEQSKPKFHQQKHPLYDNNTIPQPPPISSAMDWIPADAFTSSASSRSLGGRSLSASRVSRREESTDVPTITASNTRLNQHLYASTNTLPTSSTSSSNPLGGGRIDLYNDRKIELLTKKIKYIDDHMKAIDKENKQSQEKIQEISSANQKTHEQQRQDHKLIQSLKDSYHQLKLKIDLLMNSEEIREKLNHSYHPPQSHQGGGHLLNNIFTTAAGNIINPNTALLDPNHLEEFIVSKIQSTFINTIEETLLKHEKLHQFRQQQTTTSSQQNLKESNKYFIEQITTLEKEVLKQKNEISSLKSKQSYLDSIYTEMKSNLSIKELENQENHKKNLKNYRLEFNTMLTQTQEEIHSKLSIYQTQQKELHEMKEQFDQSLTKMGNLFGEFDIKLTSLEKNQLNQNNTINMMKTNDLLPLQQKVNDCEQSIQYINNEIEVLYAVRDDTQSLTEVQTLHNNKFTILEQELTQMNEIIKTNTHNFQLLQQEIQRIPQEFQEKFLHLSENLEKHTQTTHQSIDILMHSQKKLKTKINDIITNLQTLNHLKEQIEKLIKELEMKIVEEMSHTYELQTNIQKNAYLVNYLNEKYGTLEKLFDEQQKQIIEDGKQREKQFNSVVSGLQESMEHRLQRSTDNVEQRIQTILQEKKDIISHYSNEYQQLQQDFTQFKKDQADYQNVWTSSLMKQIQQQLQQNIHDIHQQYQSIQKESREIQSKYEVLHEQNSSVVETISYFNETVSNIANKIEFLEKKVKDADEESKQWKEELQFKVEQEEKKKAELEEKNRAALEEKKRIEAEERTRALLEEKIRAELEEKNRKELEETRKSLSKEQQRKKETQAKREDSESLPSERSDEEYDRRDSDDDHDDHDHYRRHLPQRISTKHYHSASKDSAIKRSSSSRLPEEHDSDHDRNLRRSKDNDRRKGKSPKHRYYEEEEPSFTRNSRHRDDENDDGDDYYQGSSGKRSSHRHVSPRNTARNSRDRDDEHRSSSRRSPSSAKKHSAGDRREIIDEVQFDDEDVVHTSYKLSPKYDRSREKDRSNKENNQKQDKQRYEDSSESSKHRKERSNIPPRHPPPKQDYRQPPSKGSNRYDAAVPLNVGSSFQDGWPGVTSDLSSHGDSGDHYYGDVPIDTVVQEETSNRSREEEEKEEEGEEEDDDEDNRHYPIDPHPPPTYSNPKRKFVGEEESSDNLDEEELEDIDKYIQLLNSSSKNPNTRGVSTLTGIAMEERKRTAEESHEDEIAPVVPAFSISPAQKYSPTTLNKAKVKAQLANIPGSEKAAAQSIKAAIKLTKPALFHFPSELISSQGEGGIIDYTTWQDQTLMSQSSTVDRRLPSYETYSPPSTTTTLTSSPTPPPPSVIQRQPEQEERKDTFAMKQEEDDEEEQPPTDFATFHALIDKVHSDIVALDLQSIKQQPFEEFYCDPKTIASSPPRPPLQAQNQKEARVQGKEEAVQTIDNTTIDLPAFNLRRTERDYELTRDSSVVTFASDVSVFNIDDKREDETIASNESSSIGLLSRGSVPRFITTEEPRTRIPINLIATAQLPDVPPIEKVSSSSSASSQSKDDEEEGRKGNASPLSSASSSPSHGASPPRYSLNDLASISIHELNRSLEYYDEEDDPLMVESRAAAASTNKELLSSDSDDNQMPQREEEEDDSGSDDGDSLDRIQFYSPKDLNMAKQTDLLAKEEATEEDEAPKEPPRVPLDVISEFESLLNRPRSHSTPKAIEKSPSIISPPSALRPPTIESSMNWNALATDPSKEQVDALEIPEDLFDGSEEGDDVSSMKDTTNEHSIPQSLLPHPPTTSLLSSQNRTGEFSSILDDFDEEVEEIKEYLLSDSPRSRGDHPHSIQSNPDEQHHHHQQQQQQRLHSLSEKKRKHRLQFLASLKQQEL